MRPYFFLFTLLINISVFSQTTKDSVYYAKMKHPGTKMVPVHHGKYKVFTQKIGNGKIKLLLLHGGPSNGHEYFENFPEHLAKHGVTIYYFDQLGSYYSDNPLDSTAYTAAAFVDHVEEVRKGLKLKNFYLLGHSWGGMLAELYAQKYQKHIKGLILSNVQGWDFSPNDKTKKFSDSLTTLVFSSAARHRSLQKYPPAVVDSVVDGEGITDKALEKAISRQYSRALDTTMTRFTFYYKDGPLPEPMLRDELHKKPTIKNPYLMKLQAGHKRLDYKTALLSLQTKTLLLGSAHDYMYPQGYYDMQKAMSKAKVRVEIVPNGSHFAMWDDTENYFAALTRFLKDVEGGRF
jgi:proline iminopeptidase